MRLCMAFLFYVIDLLIYSSSSTKILMSVTLHNILVSSKKFLFFLLFFKIVLTILAYLMFS